MDHNSKNQKGNSSKAVHVLSFDAILSTNKTYPSIYLSIYIILEVFYNVHLCMASQYFIPLSEGATSSQSNFLWTIQVMLQICPHFCLGNEKVWCLLIKCGHNNQTLSLGSKIPSVESDHLELVQFVLMFHVGNTLTILSGLAKNFQLLHLLRWTMSHFQFKILTWKKRKNFKI